MTFGGSTYGSVSVGGSISPPPCPICSPNLIVMEILQELQNKGIYIYIDSSFLGDNETSNNFDFDKISIR